MRSGVSGTRRRGSMKSLVNLAQMKFRDREIEHDGRVRTLRERAIEHADAFFRGGLRLLQPAGLLIDAAQPPQCGSEAADRIHIPRIRLRQMAPRRHTLFVHGHRPRKIGAAQDTGDVRLIDGEIDLRLPVVRAQ